VLALLDHHLLDLGGTYGDPDAGDPIQYDELRIEHDRGDVEIVVYNRVLHDGRSPCPDGGFGGSGRLAVWR
jgi:hypothetical protein